MINARITTLPQGTNAENVEGPEVQRQQLTKATAMVEGVEGVAVEAPKSTVLVTGFALLATTTTLLLEIGVGSVTKANHNFRTSTQKNV